AVLIAVAAAGWVIHPILFRRWSLVDDTVSSQAFDSEARKRVALAALKDAEYDRAAGKLDEADYAHIRSRLEREALEALQAADSATSPPPPAPLTHGCGFLNPGGSRFCSGCGQRLA